MTREVVEAAWEILKLGRIVALESAAAPSHRDVESFEEIKSKFLEGVEKFEKIKDSKYAVMANPNRIGGGRGH